MISWTKLRDGSWGIRIDGASASAAHVPGATVTVVRRDGTVKDAVLGRLVFESLEEGLAVFATGAAVQAPERAIEAPPRVRAARAGAPACGGQHTKTDGSWWENDRQGIPLARVCSACRAVKLAKFRPEVFAGEPYGE